MLSPRLILSLLFSVIVLTLSACADEETGISTATPTTAPTTEPSGAAEVASPAPEALAGAGTIEIRVTDPPPPDIEHYMVALKSVEVHRQKRGEGSPWLTIVDEPVTFDLVDLAEIEEFLGSKIVETGVYTQIRMHVDSVMLTIEGGEVVPARIPNQKIQIVRPFRVEANQTTELLLDFDGDRSLVVTGTGEFIFKPVIKLTVPLEGGVRPAKVRPAEEREEELTLQLEGGLQPGLASTLVVTDADGNPVEGAMVRLKLEWEGGSTGEDGVLVVDIPIDTTEFSIVAEFGELEGEVEVKFLDDGTVEIEAEDEELVLQLEGTVEPGASLNVMVADPSGNPVPDAEVSVKAKSEAGITDIDGQLIIDMPEGATELEVKAQLGNRKGELEVRGAEEGGVSPTGTPPQSLEASQVIAPLILQLEGVPQAGATLSLLVTDVEGEAVEGATVKVNGEEVGNTDAEGRLSFSVPEGADELEVEAKLYETEGKLEIELGSDD